MGATDPTPKLPFGLILTPLPQIAHPKGAIFHALKAQDASFHGFGEAYFTHILQGQTKGWRQHQKMWLNLVVPVGAVRFHLHDEATNLGTHVLLANAPEHYARLTVPPGIWMAFSGVGNGTNLVLNLANMPHDPAETANAALERWALAGL